MPTTRSHYAKKKEPEEELSDILEEGARGAQEQARIQSEYAVTKLQLRRAFLLSQVAFVEKFNIRLFDDEDRLAIVIGVLPTEAAVREEHTQYWTEMVVEKLMGGSRIHAKIDRQGLIIMAAPNMPSRGAISTIGLSILFYILLQLLTPDQRETLLRFFEQFR